MEFDYAVNIGNILATKNQQVKIICVNEVKVGIKSTKTKQKCLETPMNLPSLNSAELYVLFYMAGSL